MLVLSHDLSPTFLNTGTKDDNFQRSEKQDSFLQILKSSASMYESLGSQFFTATTAGRNAFDKSGLIISF